MRNQNYTSQADTLSNRRRQAGYSLIEVLIVITIVAGLFVAGDSAFGWGRRGRQAGQMARNLMFAMAQARGDATGDGTQRRLVCNADTCEYQTANTRGMGPVAEWHTLETPVHGDRDGLLWSVTDDDPLGPEGEPLSEPVAITFYPNGTASAATLHIGDDQQGHRFKLRVFAATGLTRLSDSW